MADDRTVTDTERDDTDDTTPRGIANRLNRVAKIVERANARLDRISAVLADPPDPDKPPIRDALNAVKTEAQAAIDKCDAMLARL